VAVPILPYCGCPPIGILGLSPYWHIGILWLFPIGILWLSPYWHIVAVPLLAYCGCPHIGILAYCGCPLLAYCGCPPISILWLSPYWHIVAPFKDWTGCQNGSIALSKFFTVKTFAKVFIFSFNFFTLKCRHYIV